MLTRESQTPRWGLGKKVEVATKSLRPADPRRAVPKDPDSKTGSNSAFLATNCCVNATRPLIQPGDKGCYLPAPKAQHQNG